MGVILLVLEQEQRAGGSLCEGYKVGRLVKANSPEAGVLVPSRSGVRAATCVGADGSAAQPRDACSGPKAGGRRGKLHAIGMLRTLTTLHYNTTASTPPHHSAQ